MFSGVLKLDTDTLKLIVEASKELKSEKDVMGAYSRIEPLLREESDKNEISENVPEQLRPLANALYGLIHGTQS